jgi:hypothetical protein
MSVLDLLIAKDKWLLALFAFLPMLLVLCFYFTLTFFQFLHKDDFTRAARNKNWGILCLLLFFVIPIIYSMYKLRFG